MKLEVQRNSAELDWAREDPAKPLRGRQETEAETFVRKLRSGKWLWIDWGEEASRKVK